MRLRGGFIPREAILTSADCYEIIGRYVEEIYLPSCLIRKETSEGIVLDCDETGALARIDIDNASKKVQLEKLFLNKLPSDIHSVAG